MAWVRFDDGFFRHPKVVTAGRDARDLYMAAVFYANANLTDGFIPARALRIIAADADIDDAVDAAGSLVGAGLWLEVDNGYQVHDYLEYQGSAESITASREANAKRQEAWRAKNRNAKSNAGRNAKSNAVTNGPGNGGVAPLNKNKNINTTNSNELVEPPIPPKGDSDAPSPSDLADNKFDEFWRAYPKKADKKAARKSFERINWREVYFADVMASLEKQKKSEQWTKDDGKYIPYPSTWLNNDRWGDELRPAAVQSTSPHSPTQMTTAQRLALQAKREREEYEQARSNGNTGDAGHGMAGEADNGRNEPGLFLVPGRRTG